MENRERNVAAKGKVTSRQRRSRRTSRRRKQQIRRFVVLGIIVLIGILLLWLICFFIGSLMGKKEKTKEVEQPKITEMLLTENPYSRPGMPLEKVKGVVVHYTANPGSDAKANRNYFEGLRKSKATYASSHFIIGLDGAIIQCIPLEEISYASNHRNSDTISIECCHETEDGKFNKETYQSLIKLLAWLCGKYNLKQDDIIRHYDVTGKDCPRYYVKDEKKWEQLKKEVFLYIENNCK